LLELFLLFPCCMWLRLWPAAAGRASPAATTTAPSASFAVLAWPCMFLCDKQLAGRDTDRAMTARGAHHAAERLDLRSPCVTQGMRHVPYGSVRNPGIRTTMEEAAGGGYGGLTSSPWGVAPTGPRPPTRRSKEEPTGHSGWALALGKAQREPIQDHSCSGTNNPATAQCIRPRKGVPTTSSKPLHTTSNAQRGRGVLHAAASENVVGSPQREPPGAHGHDTLWARYRREYGRLGGASSTRLLRLSRTTFCSTPPSSLLEPLYYRYLEVNKHRGPDSPTTKSVPLLHQRRHVCCWTASSIWHPRRGFQLGGALVDRDVSPRSL
jgi:hypothetical protein